MRALLFILGFGCVVLCSCSSTPEVASVWHRPSQPESTSSFQYFEKEKIGISVSNDSARLHIVVKTIDRDTRAKIVRAGMTLWFDSTGSEKKIVGIHFPLGLEAEGIAAPTHTRGSKEELDPSNDFSGYEAKMHTILQNAEIIGPGPLDKTKSSKSSLAETRDIHLTMSDTLSGLTYELDLPLSAIGAFRSLASASSGPISLGILTGELHRQIRASGNPESGPNGGMGMRGSRGGSRGGFRGSGDKENIEPIELWMKLSLARNP